MRVLEVARQRMAVDAAVAVVATPKKEPILATVGLSQAEVAQVGRMGVPDYRGARALQVRSTARRRRRPAGRRSAPGSPCPLLDMADRPGMLAVLTRAPDRRFSEARHHDARGRRQRNAPRARGRARDSRAGSRARSSTRSPTSTTGGPSTPCSTARSPARAEHGATHAPDPRRRSPHDDQRAHRPSRRRRRPRADRADAPRGRRRGQPACRIGGGRFGVLVPGGDTRDAERVFERLQTALRERPFADLGQVTVSGGAAELLSGDDAAALLGRADSALGLAKVSGRDTVVTAAQRNRAESAARSGREAALPGRAESPSRSSRAARGTARRSTA